MREADHNPSPDEDTRYASFVALLPQHGEAMLRVASALVGPADAEDAAQEAIVRAWQAWSSLRDPAAERAWLLRITVNVCRDWRRGRLGTHQRLTTSLDDFSEEGAAGNVATSGDDPGASDHSNALDLRWAVNTLGDDLRMIVLLRYYAGMDTTAVGAALDLPPATVRTRLKRALGMLRERLAGPEERSEGLASDSPHERQQSEGRR